jgi:multidrug transporter EmrE-like cation transporter
VSPWALLAIAIAVEVVGTVNLKYSDGFTRPLPTAAVIVSYVVCFYLVSLVTRELPLSTVYAVWAGAGTAAIAMIGVVALGETLSPLRAVSLAMVIVGIVGLNLAGSH